MRVRVLNIEVNYIQYGRGKDIVLLHGWGQNIEMMKILGDKFSDNFRITILDLPGFGRTASPFTPWTIYNYASFLDEFLCELSVKNPIIIGHSFGGRIAICYAGTHDTSKLVLLGSPCIRHDEKLSFKVRLLKFLNRLPFMNSIGEYMKNFIGSRDYKAATPVMRKILVNTVNEDLSLLAKKISCPTLLIWGENDVEAPLTDARELETIISDAGLIVIPGGSHYAYIEALDQVVSILNTFF